MKSRNLFGSLFQGLPRSPTERASIPGRRMTYTSVLPLWKHVLLKGSDSENPDSLKTASSPFFSEEMILERLLKNLKTILAQTYTSRKSRG